MRNFKNFEKNLIIFFFSGAFAIFVLAAQMLPVWSAPNLTREINLQNIALNKCEQYLKAGRFEDAIKSFEEAKSYANAIEKNQNFKRVSELFFEKKKDYIKQLTDSGNKLFTEKKYEDSEKIFKKILVFEPQNGQAIDKIMLCQKQLTRLEYNREVTSDPSLDIKTMEKGDSKYAGEMFRRALESIKEKKFTAALDLLLKSREQNTQNKQIDEQIKLVKTYIRISKNAKAFNAAVSINPLNPTCEVILNDLSVEDKPFKLRIASLDETSYARHLIAIATFYLHQLRHDEAELILKKCMEFASERDEALFLLGKIYYDKKDFYQSYKTFKSLRTMGSLDTMRASNIRNYYYELIFRIYKLLILCILIQISILSLLAYRSYAIIDYAFNGIITQFFTFKFYDAKYYLEKGMGDFNHARYQKALSSLIKCTSMDKSNISARYAMGVCYYQTKTYDQARTALETLMKMMPNHQRGAYYLALLYDHYKMPVQAVAMLEIARGITVVNRNFTMLEVEKNKRIYLGVFQDYKISADKILGLNEKVIG